MQLIVESRQLLDAARVEVGGAPLWVRAEPVARRWDLEIVRPILEGDEYHLAPIAAAGHRLARVLDIGAHVGAFTLRVKRSWPEAEVIAVEPDPDSAALFRANTEGLPGVVLHEAAVLGRSGIGEARLRQAGRANPDRNAAASWVEEAVAPLFRHSARPTAVVRALGILDLLDRHGNPPVDLLKLDCEGAEAEILEALAAAGRLRRIGWIRGEWHYAPTPARIEAALAATHVVALHRGVRPWGAFLAHRSAGQVAPATAGR